MDIQSAKDLTPETRDAFVADLVQKCNDILKEYPENRCAKYAVQCLECDKINSLSNDDLFTFYQCIRTGIENKDSSLGCYAMTPDDYAKFNHFFDKVIRDYHGDKSGKKKHKTNWTLPKDADYDVKKLGQDELSMRVRVGRNLSDFNLPGKMDKDERIAFEKKMLPAFEELKENYGGHVYSLTPDFNGEENPNLISDEEYQELVKSHVMFKDMSADPYLHSAGISSDWPYGRGCWQSQDKTRIIWFGEEDHLRIMCMKKGTNLAEVFMNLKDILDSIEKVDGLTFAKSDKYGYVTSCPSNLGTGMRASVHIKIPKLTSDGTDVKAKEICKPLGLSVRGTGGEHTPIGLDGTVDISPSSRLFIQENEIIGKLYEGIENLMEIENSTRRRSVRLARKESK
jgi:creatine kinase